MKLLCRVFGHAFETPYVSGRGHVCRRCGVLSKAKRFGTSLPKGWKL